MLTAEKALKLANAGFAFDASHIQRTPKNNANDVAEVEVEAQEGEEQDVEDGS